MNLPISLKKNLFQNAEIWGWGETEISFKKRERERSEKAHSWKSKEKEVSRKKAQPKSTTLCVAKVKEGGGEKALHLIIDMVPEVMSKKVVWVKQSDGSNAPWYKKGLGIYKKGQKSYIEKLGRGSWIVSNVNIWI